MIKPLWIRGAVLSQVNDRDPVRPQGHSVGPTHGEPRDSPAGSYVVTQHTLVNIVELRVTARGANTIS